MAGKESYIGPSYIHKMKKDDVKREWMNMPSDDIDPKEKKGAWSLAWAQFIYSMFYNGQCYTTWDRLQEYRLNRLYGAGNQPREFYMDWLEVDIDSKTQERAGYYNVNWDIWSPAPKFKRVILGRMESQEHRIVANAIDPLSGQEKENEKWKAWERKLFGKKENEIKASIGMAIPETQEYIPESMEELEMYDQMGGFKLRKEIDIEKGLKYTDHISNWKEIKRKLIGDGVDINIFSYRDYYDPVLKKVMEEYMDPEYCVFDYSKERNFSDMRFWAYQKLYSIKQLRMESGIPEEKLQKYAIMYANQYGNYGDFTTLGSYGNALSNYRNKDGVYVYDMYKVPVWICEWKSVDTKYKTKRTTTFGDVYFPEEYGKVVDSKKKKTEVTESQNVYTCKWIVGSDMVFGDGPLDVIPRDSINKAARMSAHVYALPGQSIMRSIRNNLDQIQLTKLKLENDLAKAAPRGYKIEFSTLNGINLGDGDLSPLELIKMRTQTGSFIYKATTLMGKYNQYADPIAPLEGGIGAALEEYIRLFEVNFQQIAETTGIDRVSSVSQKPGEMTATQANYSVAATTDALQPLYQGYLDVKESGARNVSYRIQTIVKYIPEAYDVYYPVLGRATLENLKISRDITDASYGIIIEALPTDQERQQILLAATEALKPGKDGENISFGEYLLITSMVNRGQLKEAVAILNFRMNKRRKEAQMLQQQNMELNAKSAAEQERIKGENAIREIEVKAAEDRKTELLKAVIAKDAKDDDFTKQLQQKIIDTYLGGMLPQSTTTASAPVAA